LGKLSGVLERLLYDIVVFFGFFLLEVVFFSGLADLAFRKVDSWNSMLKAFRNLFYASFGQFNFDVFVDAEFSQHFGIAFLIIFLVINIGLFMSLFTAMMTTLYSAFVQKKNVFYMLETLKIRPQTQSDRNYSALISLPAPLNVLLLILGPFLATSFHS